MMKTMKKYVRILLVAMMSLMVLALAGCGEEDKYNQAKAEVLTMVEQVKTVNDRKDSPFFSNDGDKNKALLREHGQERIDILKGELQNRTDLYNKIDEKLKDMVGYAKGNGKLEADLAELKKKIESDKAGWIRLSKEQIAAEEMAVRMAKRNLEWHG